MSPSSAAQTVQFLLFSAGAFLAMALVYSLWKFEHLARAARQPSESPLDAEATFLLRVAGRMGLGRSGSGAVSVAFVEPVPPAGRPAPEPGAFAPLLAQALRGGGTDEAAALDATRVGVILDCEPAHLARIRTRWEQRTGLALRVGVAGFPDSGSGAESVMAAADLALAEVPASGGIAFHPADLAGEGPDAEEEAPHDERLVDALTGVLRSERVGAAALKFMARLRREGRNVSLVVLDFDSLSEMNERYGREAGDAALRGMGRVLRRVVRESDLIGRLEDDAFLVLASGNGEHALRIGRRILDAYGRAPTGPGPAGARGTVSAGVAEAPQDAREFADLLRKAQRALARGRRTGRGRCTRFQPDMERSPGPSGERLQDRF